MKLRDDDELKFVVRNFNEMLQELKYMGQNDYDDLVFIKKKLSQEKCDKEVMDKLISLEERMTGRISKDNIVM